MCYVQFVRGKIMRFIFFSFLLVFCFSILGSSLCRNSIVELHGQVETAITSGRDLVALDRVSKSLWKKYTNNPNRFLSVFRENINSEDVFERRAVLDVIKYMKDTPLAIQRLVMERLEDPYSNVREAAFKALMAFDIRDTAILQQLEATRREESGMNRIWAERVLEIQESKARLRKEKAQKSKDSS